MGPMRLQLYASYLEPWQGTDAQEQGTCDIDDIDLTGNLLSFWPLIDGGSLEGDDQGPSGQTFIFDGVNFEFDAGRVPAEGGAHFVSNAFADLTDSSGFYLPSTDGPFTLGIYLRFDDKGATVTILSYVNGADTQYELIYDDGRDRFVWAIQTSLGTAIVAANALGSPIVGQWYWIELSYDPAGQYGAYAAIRVARDRTANLVPLSIDADVVLLDGAAIDARLTPEGDYRLDADGNQRFGYAASGAWDFVLGHSGANSLVTETELDGFTGCMLSVGFWADLLSNCERGTVNQPMDYPWQLRTTAEADYRVDADGNPRIYK